MGPKNRRPNDDEDPNLVRSVSLSPMERPHSTHHHLLTHHDSAHCSPPHSPSFSVTTRTTSTTEKTMIRNSLLVSQVQLMNLLRPWTAWKPWQCPRRKVSYPTTAAGCLLRRRLVMMNPLWVMNPFCVDPTRMNGGRRLPETLPFKRHGAKNGSSSQWTMVLKSTYVKDSLAMRVPQPWPVH